MQDQQLDVEPKTKIQVSFELIEYQNECYSMKLTYVFRKENIPLPGQEIVSTRSPGRAKKYHLEPVASTSSSSIQLAVATLPRPVEDRQPPISTPHPKGEIDGKTEKRSFYKQTLEGLNQSRNKRSEKIMELQEKILALQQKLEEQMRTYKSETEMIDNLKTNATVDDIQLSEEEGDEPDEDDIVVDLLNLKGEPADDAGN